MSESRKEDARRPTLQTIAERAGVSHQTVSNVLNAPEKVAAETRARVQAAITEVNYRPNETARSLARRSTRLVSFHVGSGQSDEASILNPFMRQLARVGSTHGYRVVLDVATDDDYGQIASFEELHARQSVDGVIIPETHAGDRRPAWLLEHGVPMVAFGRPWDDTGASHSWIDVDGAAGMRMVAAHLAANGHRRIAYVGPARNMGMEDDRIGGLYAGLRDAGVEPEARLEVSVENVADLRRDLPSVIMQARPTALACRDDSFAFEATQIVAELGLRVGHDIAVTGFDDSDLAGRSRPSITSVAQPIEDVTKLIWQSLLEQFSNPLATPIQRITSPSLVVRESSSFVVAAGHSH